jgi:hypothetical protein
MSFTISYRNIEGTELVRHWLKSRPEIVAVHDTLEKFVIFEKQEYRKEFLDYITGRA